MGLKYDRCGSRVRNEFWYRSKWDAKPWIGIRKHEAGENGFKFQRVLGESKVDEAVMISRILPPLEVSWEVYEVDVIDEAIPGEQIEYIVSRILLLREGA